MEALHFSAPLAAPATEAADFSEAAAAESLAFHATLPGYAETPLKSLSSLARRLGLASVTVKDESPRFGLNSFKGLGGSRLAAAVMAERLGLADLPAFDRLQRLLAENPDARTTLCSATDGNHGRGIAWAAKALGLPCVIWLPKGSARERVEAIRALGADARVTNVNYDHTVVFARAEARRNRWVFVQDTDDEKSSDKVKLLMLGYLTLAEEIRRRLPEAPTHVFLQAGVGSFAGAMAAFFANVWRETPPVFIVVEAQNAGCIAQTAAANDGEIHAVAGDLQTMMAGLSCGTPCRLAWKLLRGAARHFVIVTDAEAALAMRVLGNPLADDPRIVSGESGAAGVAALLAACADASTRTALGLTHCSRVLCICTEGDTDAANYRRVTWQGQPASNTLI